MPIIGESDKDLVKELKELNTKRSSIKGQITKYKNFLSNASQRGELSSIDLAELSLKLGKFEALSLRFDELQTQIEVINSDNLLKELDERESIEHEFVINIAASKKIIEDHNIMEVSQRRESNFHDANAHFSADCKANDLGFKLPQIQISKFDGSYFRWLEFHDMFESLIHNNNRIANIHKFHYLVSYLEGDAARLISNLEMSSANYIEAWKLLCDRYSNKRLLINHHLNSLINIQSILRESERSLRFLVDHMTKNLRALSSLGQPTEHWDTLLIFMFSSKLDSHTRVKWEEYRNSLDDVPTLNQFKQFLVDRADVLESISRNSKYDANQSSKHNESTSSRKGNWSNFNNNNAKMIPNTHNNNKYSSHSKSFTTISEQNTNQFICIICGENHRIYDCATFKAKSLQERIADVERYKLCLNCLRQGHSLNNCRMGPCRECKRRHNTLMHTPKTTVSNMLVSDSDSKPIISNHTTQNHKHVFLSTAIIEVINPSTSQTTKVRALLDSGSQSTFITKALRDKLALKSTPLHAMKVIGIGNKCNNQVVETCITKLNSLNTNFHVKLSCLVLDELTSDIPKVRVDIHDLNIPIGLALADPTFNQPSTIDVLIGADIFWDIINSEQQSLGPGNPKLQSSKLGWLVSGPINVKNKYNKIQCNLNHNFQYNLEQEVHKMLPIFWNLEEVPHKSILSESDKYCENHFIQNTVRLPSGRFRVKLPLRESPDCLGDTYAIAKRRFLNLEKRFKRNPVLKTEYFKFISEYERLGHLSELFVKPDISYFLCHHAVLKENSESTKLRVVFDGSASSTSGYSLNDILTTGPNVQDSLFSILIRARQYKYIFTGDVEKMYRMVEVSENDRNLQLILWRDKESDPIKIFKLHTLTYGTASASYLSTRCIYQLGEECDDKLIKNIIQSDFYVDDVITGSDSDIQLRHIQTSVSQVLKKGCFILRKYKTNCPTLFQNCKDEHNQENLTFSESTSTLGMGWNPTSDCFNFPTKNIIKKIVTKRTIMSQSFQIFDPLGLLSPCIIIPKIMLQKLWIKGLGWDTSVPSDIENDWKVFCDNLQYLQTLQVPRLVLCSDPIQIELHSFSDASLQAYGACIYMRSVNKHDDVTVRLLCSKSRVAPVKPTTIPRLELCAALLAARLCKSITNAIRYKPARMIHWCDSSIVLAWVHNDPKKLKTFVANRIIEITDLTDSTSWRYVPTSHNPADLISRGIHAGRLRSSNLWWHGPEFLQARDSEWPILNSNDKCNEREMLLETKSNTIVTNEFIIDFKNYSKLNTLQRSMAYVKRFIHNSKLPDKKSLGSLSLSELDDSFYLLCSVAQQQSFPTEYVLLRKGKSLDTKSKIMSLSPFFDDNYNIIRVGGRLDTSNYAYEKKHPVLLHASHHLTKLIFEREHLRTLHSGPQLLLASVREIVWPVNGRRLARRVVNNCVRCRRFSGKTLCPKMGDLPSQRITPDYPFISVGLDYAGPFYILNRKGRGSRLIKCYLCLFVCLRYKCLHLEVVSDLSKESFLMTLRRFIARRGKPAEIFSDNGRNFVASAKEITLFLRSNAEPLSDFATQEGIKFVFIPTYAPHFGGIWEAGVKSAKYHIKRVVANSHLTYEEMSTLFAQVEAILNSRPLCPLSSSPDDFLSLSPGHFLIGRPLTALPSPNLDNVKEHSLRRYQLLERLRQHFWKRWQKEYIGELQQRTKWKTSMAKLSIGDMVLIQEDNVPPLNWRLGRVTRLYPGPDGLSRVADINTTRGCVRRPLVRLCPLPNDEDLQY